MTRILAFIPARGGSRGVPRKALQMLGDMPLLAYTIRDALNIEGITKVFVSTDDPEIRSVSFEYGAEVPFLRPPHLAQDDSRLEDAHRYSLEWYEKNETFKPEIEIVMSPTHPFRRRGLVTNTLKMGLSSPDVFNLGSISEAKVDPYNYWLRREGRLERFQFSSREASPPPRFYQSALSFNIVFSCRPHLPNRRVPVLLNEIESIDIDEPSDLEMARRVLSDGLYPFNDAC
jgi:CMP-N-acetylneuraminic acid synthetase